MLHAEIGETHLNNLLTSLNLPLFSRSILKNRENEIGTVLETFAKKSARTALFTEKKS